MEWLCRDCFFLVFPNRIGLGMTSRHPQECKACGESSICVMDNGPTIEEARQILARQKEGKHE